MSLSELPSYRQVQTLDRLEVVGSSTGTLELQNEGSSSSSSMLSETINNDNNRAEAPPGYSQAERPETNVTYTFSPAAANTMVLLPPVESPNTRPKFHVSVGMNPIVPLSYVTTIRRGGTEEGEFIGEFELNSGLATDQYLFFDWVTYANLQRQPITKVLAAAVYTSDGSKRFRVNSPMTPQGWQYENSSFYWCFDEGVVPAQRTRTCYATAEEPRHKAKVYARYKPRTVKSDGGVELETLQVTPEGHGFLDQIFLSLLILERRRLMPRLG